MKKSIIICATLSLAIVKAQKKDSLNSHSIDEVILNGKYYKKYLEKHPSSSLRLEENLLNIPQNVSVITNQAMEDQQITTIGDGVLRNVAGAERIEHWGDLYTRINMRGSRAAAFLNGVNTTSNWGPLSEDMSYVDHIEFVKGPAGFLMSNGEPSGIYNIVTKKPTGNDFNGSARVTLGRYNMYRGEADLDGRVSKKVSVRLNIMAENKDSFRKYEFSDRYIINPSVKVELTDNTTLTAEYIYQKAKMSQVGSAYVFTFDGYGTHPADYTIGDPGIAPTNITDHTANINLQHRFNDRWKLTTQLTYLSDYTMGSDVWPGMVDAATGNMIRNLNFWEAQNTMKFGQVFLNGYEKTGAVSHRVLAGLDMGNKKYLADWSQGGPLDTALHPFNTNSTTYSTPANPYPVFNGSTPLAQRANPYGTISQSYTGLYLQDELGFLQDKLRLTLAARYTTDKEASYGGPEAKAEKLTPRVGLSYSIDDNTSAYALYDQAFVPQTGLFRDGTSAKPLTGSNYEVGLKRDWLGGKWNTTLSLYNILKNNAITGDPTDLTYRYSILLGQTKVQGVEFETKGELAPGFNAILNYAFTENKFTENTAVSKKGQSVPGYAKNTVNGWLNYTFLDGVAKGFGLSFGGSYLGDRSTWNWGSTTSPLTMNDYLKFDAGASWENGKIKINLNVFNVFNRYLYSGSGFSFRQPNGSYMGGYYYQAESPRNARLSIGYRF